MEKLIGQYEGQLRVSFNGSHWIAQTWLAAVKFWWSVKDQMTCFSFERMKACAPRPELPRRKLVTRIEPSFNFCRLQALVRLSSG